MSALEAPNGFYWHESAGASILVPDDLRVQDSFPQFYAASYPDRRSILIEISSNKKLRESSEELFNQPPKSTPNISHVEIIRNQLISKPFSGKELLWEIHLLVKPKQVFSVERILELDESAGLFAVIGIHGEGAFCESEAVWQTVLNSFSWQAEPHDDSLANKAKPKQQLRKNIACASSSGKLPLGNETPFIRTDFSDEDTWQSICELIESGNTLTREISEWANEGDGEGEFRVMQSIINDPNYADLSLDQLLELLPDGPYHSFLFVIDKQTISIPERPILVVELGDKPHRTFRTPPEHVFEIESNLSLANIDWEDFAKYVDEFGIFRGFSGA